MNAYTPERQQQLLGLAYQMTGRLATSQDICQEVWLCYWERSQQTTINHPLAYLRRMVINASLDALQALAKEREVYPGVWLPEPMFEAPSHSQLDLSYGLTVVLSRLKPKERAVFLLKECFDYPYQEIADTLALTTANCRKIYQRLTIKIKQEAPQQASAEEQATFLMQFLEASGTGNLEDFVALLREDIALYSDGGGKVSAAVHPLYGAVICRAFLQGIARKIGDNIDVRPCLVHQQWGWVIYEQKQLTTLILCDWKEGGIQNLFFIRNPDKLPLELLQQ